MFDPDFTALFVVLMAGGGLFLLLVHLAEQAHLNRNRRTKRDRRRERRARRRDRRLREGLLS